MKVILRPYWICSEGAQRREQRSRSFAQRTHRRAADLSDNVCAPI